MFGTENLAIPSVPADDLTRLTLSEAARGVAARQVSPVELTDAYLRRIYRVERVLNAYVTVTPERARADAVRAEAELARRGPRTPLHGLPLGIKDLFDTAGIRTTGGSWLRRDRVPNRDSAVAARLRAAGAVLLGKHATHELAWGGTTNNPHFGPTRNPHDLSRIPGGSSGGSAASIVAGTSLASVGTDTCGSVRIPAALCGCVGLKPTYGRIDLAGVLPLAPSLDHAGPLTRTVEDAALVYSVLAPGDSRWLSRLHDPVAGLRVARLRGWFEDVIDPEVAAALDGAAGVLADLGCDVVDLTIPDVGPIVDLVFRLVAAEAVPFHRPDFEAAPDAFGADLRGNLSNGEPTPEEVAQARATLSRMVAALSGGLERADVLLAATTPAPAPPIGSDRVTVGGRDLHIEWMLTRLTSIFDVARLPALSVPSGSTRAGLPVGLQLVGRPGDEATVLRIGCAYEAARDEEVAKQ